MRRAAAGATGIREPAEQRNTWPARFAPPGFVGYTNGMKIAISIPDDVFEEAERLARQRHRSRSDLYTRALSEYVARHAPDRVTESMNAVLETVGEPADDFAPAAGRRALGRVEW